MYEMQLMLDESEGTQCRFAHGYSVHLILAVVLLTKVNMQLKRRIILKQSLAHNLVTEPAGVAVIFIVQARLCSVGEKR